MKRLPLLIVILAAFAFGGHVAAQDVDLRGANSPSPADQPPDALDMPPSDRQVDNLAGERQKGGQLTGETRDQTAPIANRTTASTTIEFRSSTAPMVIAGIGMERRETVHTNTGMTGTFTVGSNWTICDMAMHDLVMLQGPTIPSFQVDLLDDSTLSYNVANGTSRDEPFGLGERINPKPTGKLIVELVPTESDRNGCIKPGVIFSARGPNHSNIWHPQH